MGTVPKSLRVRSREIKRYNAKSHNRELREARFLPRELTFRTNIMFWNDIVAMFSTKNDGLHVMIQSRPMREMFQQLFDLLWSVSGKMETLRK